MTNTISEAVTRNIMHHPGSMHTLIRIAFPLFLLSMAAIQPARGQDESGPIEEPIAIQRIWRLTAQPLVWFASLSGESTFRGSAATTLDVDTLLGLDDNEPGFLGSARLSYDSADHGRWLFWLEGFDFSTEANGPVAEDFGIRDTTVTAGATVISDFGLTNVDVKVGWDPFGNVLHDNEFELRFALLAGARLITLDHRLEVVEGPTVEYDTSSGCIEAGTLITIAQYGRYAEARSWCIDVALSLGAGGTQDATTTYFDIWAGAEYLVTENIGLRFGYRQIDITIEDDGTADGPYEFDGRLAGLYLGGTITF